MYGKHGGTGTGAYGKHDAAGDRRIKSMKRIQCGYAVGKERQWKKRGFADQIQSA